MSLHIFGTILTPMAPAANNRGESDGNITTLQKLLWNSQVHTTVSSEAIRWAIRYYWQKQGLSVNRVWNDDTENTEWKDSKFESWTSENGNVFIDDDVLGFMRAEGAKKESGDKKGHTDKRRGVLEISRAISLTPYAGDVTFNARSGEKDRTSLYGTEVHSTRYQYSFAFTPNRLKDRTHAKSILSAISSLGEVAGNHSRFLFDFSPESVVLRITEDPAPRILYCFEEFNGKITVNDLARKIRAGDIKEEELYVGGILSESQVLSEFKKIKRYDGIKSLFDDFKNEMEKRIEE